LIKRQIKKYLTLLERKKFVGIGYEKEEKLDWARCERRCVVKAGSRGENGGGKRPRGRPRFVMIDDLKEESYVKMKRRAEDRVAWRCWMPGRA